jgi:membrane-associated phospholipid phosphatase
MQLEHHHQRRPHGLLIIDDENPGHVPVFIRAGQAVKSAVAKNPKAARNPGESAGIADRTMGAGGSSRFALLGAALALAPPALADSSASPRATAPAFAAGEVRWRESFRRVGWPEYVAAPTLFLGALAAQALPEPSEPRWRGPILLDRQLQHFLRVDSASGRQNANTASDVLVGASAAQLLLDAWLVAAGIHGNPDVAWQMTVIDTEVYGLSELAVTMTKQLAARERPYAEHCDSGGGSHCEASNRNLSFYSGHAGSTSTFAGLTCAHHQKLALYGSFAADLGACLGSASMALATGLLRIASDNHWWSDVLVGHAVGFSAGYLLSWGLYYRDSSSGAGDASRGVWFPIVGSGVWGLAWSVRL